MSIFDWFKPKGTTLKDPEFRERYLNPTVSGAGIDVTPDTAMRLGAVYACVRILGETVASLPVRVYRSAGETREAVSNHPLNNLLGVSPNGEQTAMELREWCMTGLGLRGNAYSVVMRSNRGGVGEIVPLNPAFMAVDRGANGALVFDYQEPGNSGVYGPRDIWRIAGLSCDGVLGKSPIALAREAVGVGLAAESAAARIYTNGATPSGVLEFPHTLDDETIEHMRKQFEENYSGHRNSGKPMILESGMKYQQIGLSAADAQYLEQRKFQIAEIARMYRVPLHMLNELDKATFSNIEHQSIEFVMHTIRPWLVRIEQTISRDLLTAGERAQGLFVAHTVEGLLRGDTATRYEAYGKAITDGWMSRNEVRRLENLNPVDGLDEYVLQMNVGTVEERAAEVAALAASEIKALEVEADKRDLRSFASWLPHFYDRFANRLASDLGIDPNMAQAYGKQRIASMADFTSPTEAVEAVKPVIENDIEALIA